MRPRARSETNAYMGTDLLKSDEDISRLRAI